MASPCLPGVLCRHLGNECSLCNLSQHPQRSRLAGDGTRTRQEEGAIACDRHALYERPYRQLRHASHKVRPPQTGGNAPVSNSEACFTTETEPFELMPASWKPR